MTPDQTHCRALIFQQDPQHAPQGFCRPPQQLVTHGKRRQVMTAHCQFAQAPYGNLQASGHRGWRQFALGRFATIFNKFNPLICA